MRGRLGVIRAAAPTVFRYRCARGMKIPPAAPAKKLQRFETLRLLWRCDSVCSNSTPNLAPVRLNESFTTHLRCVLVWAAMAAGSPSIARVLVLPKPPILGGHDAATARKNKAGFSRPVRVASPEQAPKGPTIAPVMCIMTTASVQARDPLAAHRNRGPRPESGAGACASGLSPG